MTRLQHHQLLLVGLLTDATARNVCKEHNDVTAIDVGAVTA